MLGEGGGLMGGLGNTPCCLKLYDCFTPISGLFSHYEIVKAILKITFDILSEGN